MDRFFQQIGMFSFTAALIGGGIYFYFYRAKQRAVQLVYQRWVSDEIIQSEMDNRLKILRNQRWYQSPEEIEHLWNPEKTSPVNLESVFRNKLTYNVGVAWRTSPAEMHKTIKLSEDIRNSLEREELFIKYVACRMGISPDQPIPEDLQKAIEREYKKLNLGSEWKCGELGLDAALSEARVTTGIEMAKRLEMDLDLLAQSGFDEVTIGYIAYRMGISSEIEIPSDLRKLIETRLKKQREEDIRVINESRQRTRHH